MLLKLKSSKKQILGRNKSVSIDLHIDLHKSNSVASESN